MHRVKRERTPNVAPTSSTRRWLQGGAGRNWWVRAGPATHHTEEAADTHRGTGICLQSVCVRE